MDRIIDSLNSHSNKNELHFSEPFYVSKDNKTIMGEVPFSEILFLDYRDTDAGSNPREFNGLRKSNVSIIKSLLENPKNLFRFLHSGVIVSILNGSTDSKNIVKYDECCLTNGNQTRFIILIIFLLKLLFDKKDVSPIKQDQIKLLATKYFSTNAKAQRILHYVRFNKVNQVSSFLTKNKKYNDLFKSLKLDDFLNSKIRIQLNIVNHIIKDLENDPDSYLVGTMIAEANNDTQKVKTDDIFGNKYKIELEKKVFNVFINTYKNKYQIEYRLGEVLEQKDKVHILTLLRPIIATGIITKDKEIYHYTNQRDPIYKLFEKLLKKYRKKKEIPIIPHLVPFLFDIREKYVKPSLDKHKRELVRKYKELALHDELDDSVIGRELLKFKSNDQKLEKLIRTTVNYNIEHIFPVLIFQLRKLIVIDENQKIVFNIPKDKIEEFIRGLTEIIYEKYVEKKLAGLPTSLTTVVRSKDFYEMGNDSYKTFLRTMKVEENNFILNNRINI
ncbi:MAG: hypothetical protein QXG00_07720 [Candidatus Woesearchaeota archaeon]